MKAESMQSPIARYEITFLDSEYSEVDFFTNIQEKQRKYNESEEMITVFEYDHYKVKVRNRNNLVEQIEKNYDEWLEYAKQNDDREHIPTDLEVMQAEYQEWEAMDTPSTVEEMRLQDPKMAAEFLNMMIEMRKIIYTLQASTISGVEYSYSLQIPKPSEKLEAFKNKFNLRNKKK